MLALILSAVGAQALQQPLKINFQGRLTDPATNNPRNGNFNMTFRLYRAPTGGTAVFTETQSNVAVSNGVFSVQLGSAAFLNADLLDHTSAFLSVQVGGDSEMAPRQQLVMAPYAYTAAQLMSDVDVGVNSGTRYSTFTTAGNLLLSSGAVLGGSLYVQGGAGIDATYGIKAATFTGQGWGLTGADPQVKVSSSYATVTLVANTETLAVSGSITPSTGTKNVFITGRVNFIRAVNTATTCVGTVRFAIGSACGTGSAIVDAANIQLTNSTGGSVSLPILTLHSPDTTSSVNYCITVRCGAAHQYSQSIISMMEATP
jgi:hypothetical protein